MACPTCGKPRPMPRREPIDDPELLAILALARRAVAESEAKSPP